MLPVVIYVLGKLDIGGAEMRSLQFMEAVRRRHPRLRIIVYVTSDEKGVLTDRFLATGVRIVQGRSGVRALFHFWRVCLREGCTLVHANVGVTSGFFALAGLLSGARVRICHFRTTDDDRTGTIGRLKTSICLGLVRLCATRIVGVCASARIRARVPERDWLTVYNGVKPDETGEAARTDSAPGGCTNILVLGRINPVKNYERPVAIFESLVADGNLPDPRLHFVGSGSPEDMARLAARIAASPARDRILLHGPSHRPFRHLRAADMLLLTSHLEGLPGSVLEALSVGTPVVASALPGTSEIADAVDGVTLVPLEAPDSVWLDAVRVATHADRGAIARSFRAGPFGFEPYVRNMASLWALPNETETSPEPVRGVAAEGFAIAATAECG